MEEERGERDAAEEVGWGTGAVYEDFALEG